MLRKVSVMEEDWDYLIILDACRYDYFSRLYGDHLQGELEKARSPASCTAEWCRKSFKERYNDVIYVSANPHINSKVEIEGFNAKDHFFRVVDVWDFGWDDKLGMVHPQKVNEAVHNVEDKYSDKRIIIHYQQPHAPYLSHNLNELLAQLRSPRDVVLRGARNKKTNIIDRSLRILSILAEKVGMQAWKPSWKVRQLLNLPPETYIDAIRRKFGDIGLRQAYVGNLKLVLAYVRKLVEILPGVIIVTADHGDLLGEDGCYTHPCGSTNPLLREIPWLTIEKKGMRKKIEEKESITQKIKRLKALNLI